MSASRKLSYAVLCATVFFLAATGIGTFAFGKPPMTHWVLMAHVAVAPLFALALAGMALTWSGLGRGGVAKVLLWLILLAGLVVTLSGVVPMTPLCGTEGQRFLYLTHRYSAIVLTTAILLHLPTLPRRK